MLPQWQLRAPCVGVLPPGNGVHGFHQRSGGAGVTLLNASPATSPLLSLLCSTWVNALCPSCAAQLSPPPGRRPRGSCSVFVALPSSLSPMSLGSWPWLGSSLSLVPCCPLRAEPASVPVLCAGDEGCTLCVGEQAALGHSFPWTQDPPCCCSNEARAALLSGAVACRHPRAFAVSGSVNFIVQKPSLLSKQ